MAAELNAYISFMLKLPLKLSFTRLLKAFST